MQPDGGGAAGGEGAASEGTDPDVETAINEAAAALERAGPRSGVVGAEIEGAAGVMMGSAMSAWLHYSIWLRQLLREGRARSA